MDNKIDAEEVALFYNKQKSVWPDNEPWYNYTRKEISNFIIKHPFKENDYILNAGSGDSCYDIKGTIHYVDIAQDKIKNKPLHTVANIERLPFESNIFDGIVCVGSVINYCDAVSAISELARVLRPKGKLILEFENSYSFEYLGTKAYSAIADIITTQYQGKTHRNWIYSPKYIISILKQNGLSIDTKTYFHILSTLSLHFGNNEDHAASFAKYDRIANLFPFLRKHGCNLILRCTKHSFSS